MTATVDLLRAHSKLFWAILSGTYREEESSIPMERFMVGLWVDDKLPADCKIKYPIPAMSVLRALDVSRRNRDR